MQRLRFDYFKHNNISLIPAIQNSAGKLTQSPQEINGRFKDFYSKLYTTDNGPDPRHIKDFLSNLQLPQLPKDRADELDTSDWPSYRSQENAKTIKPRTRQLPWQVLRTFLGHFFSIFRAVLHIKCTSRIPPYINTDLIALILKPNEDPTLFSSYYSLHSKPPQKTSSSCWNWAHIKTQHQTS